MTRRGISLVELLVVMSGCTFVLSTSAMLIHRAMRAQSETRRFFDNERAAQRLSRQFRADVLQADDAEIDPAQLERGIFARVALQDGGSVEYRHEASAPGEIVRVQAQDEGVASRESFRLGSSVQPAVQRLDAPDRLVLQVTAEALVAGSTAEATAAAVRATPSEVRVEAVVGGGSPEALSVEAVDGEDEE
jgi:hypothetical protein